MKQQHSGSIMISRAEQIDKYYDLVVCGGGIGGVVTAVMSARKGLSVALVDNKAGLGGNACAEIGVSIDGAHCFGQFVNKREGGPVEELKERLAAMDPYGDQGMNSTVMLFWCLESGVNVYSELLIDEVVTDLSRVVRVAGSQGGTERRIAFHAEQFVDATGDGTIAARANAEYMTGREGRGKFNEILAPENVDSGIMGASLLYRASEKKEAIPFKRPEWAYDYRTEDDLPYRLSMQKGPVTCGFWWIEYAGDNDDPIGEYEQVRVELSKCLYGVWAFLKNDPSRKMENWSLDRVSISPAKRESRRIIGDIVVTEKDIVERTDFPDAVAYAGWNIDIHVPGGFKSPFKPNIHALFPWVAPLPLRALYCRDIENLWLTGRDISVSHVALGATRLQATIGAMGHAVACAAAIAHRHGLSNRETARQHINAIQQDILRDGSHIPGISNQDDLDYARYAVCTADSDQPLRFKAGNNYLSVRKGRVLSFPVTGGRVDSVTLKLRNSGTAPVDARLFFSSCLHPNHASDLNAIADMRTRIEPGEYSITWSLNLTGIPDGLYAVGVITENSAELNRKLPDQTVGNTDDNNDAGLEWQACGDTPYGCHTLILNPEYYYLPKKDAGDNLYLVTRPIMLAPDGEDTRWIREKNHRIWRAHHKYRTKIAVPAIEIVPEQRPYSASQVVSGVSHTDCMPGLWISDPEAPLPQKIELNWGGDRTLSEVRIVFDTDPDMSHPAYEPVETLVKSYRVEARVDGNWVEVVSEEDNRNRFRIHNFHPVHADALRLIVDKVHAEGETARIFEIRAYGSEKR